MRGRCCDHNDRHLPVVLMDNYLRRLISPAKKKVSEFVRAGAVVADLGCGPGYYTIPIAEIVGEGGKVYALDSDPKSIQKLREKIGPSLENVIEAHTASAAHVDMIADQCIDFVFAHGLLCCMHDHVGAIGEIKRILKHSGLAYLSVSRFYRTNDSRAVRRDEWESILQGFAVKERHEAISNHSAVVTLRNPGECSSMKT